MEIYNLLINKDIGTDKGEISAEYVRNQIDAAKKINATELKLIINSRGGSVYEGFSIYNDLKDAGIKVTAYIHGFCGSIATLIASAAGYVEMSETAQYMIHNASGGAQGTASEIESTAEALKQIDSILAQNYSNKTGRSVDEIKVLMDKTTFDKYFENDSGKPTTDTTTLNLTDNERELYNLLKTNNWRLEQEKIPFDYVNRHFDNE